MLGHKERRQPELFVSGSLRQVVPHDHVLARVDRVLDLSWLREEVAGTYCGDNGRPGIDPEVAVRLMLCGFLLGVVHDRRLMREAQVNIAIRWFVGYGLHEVLPDHSSLTRIRQRWGAERFRRIFERTVQACVAAEVPKGKVVHIDVSLIRANVSWRSNDEPEFDAQLGAPGLHSVKTKVEFSPRRTVLPPDLFEKYASLAFWRDPKGSAAWRITAQPDAPRAERPVAP